MIIGIDLRPLQTSSKYRGIGRVLNCILEHGRNDLQKHTVYFYIESNLEKPNIVDSYKDKKIIFVNSGFRKKRFIRAITGEYCSIKPQKEVDVFLQVESNLGIPLKTKSVVFFHDAIPLFFREKEISWRGNGIRGAKRKIASELYWRRYINSLASYARATKIISISKHSDNDLRNHVLPNIQIDSSVIHLSATPSKSLPKKPKFINKQYPYLLYVGGIDMRKNVVGMVEDFGKIAKIYTDLHLTFIGKEFHKTSELDDFGWSEAINTYNIADRIITPGFVTDEELAWLYEHALAFVFPSRYEGFGLPVLEAMQAGCPVIAYSNSSIPEVAGNAALLIKDGESMTPAIERLLTEKDLREDLIKKGKKQASKFSWEKTAKETIKVLEEVGRG